MNFYVPSNLESIFIEIICPQSSSVIVIYLFKHPSLAINGFTNEILSPLLKIFQKEFPVEIYLRGDFNINLLKDENNKSVNNFVDMQ